MTEQKSTEAAVPMHYWMATANVIFTGKDAEDGGVIPMNAMLLTVERRVNAHALAQAQRTLTANLHEKIPGKDTKVVDVVFTGFTHLGYMTQEEFNPGNSVKPA